MFVNHYGKNLDNLSRDEKQLLLMDTLILLGNKISDESPMVMMITKLGSNLNDIVEQRVKLSLKLLNLSIEDFSSVEETIEYIETTRYGIEKFKKDLEVNTKRIEQMERLSTLN